jgi:16S rRNA (cytosine967-C5)-methyltransferase
MNTRYLAVMALGRVLSNAERPKDALERLGADLDERERSFLMELVYGALRKRDYLDWLLSAFLRKPGGLSGNTINNLRVSVYQLRFMRVPEWAAVDEAVAIEKRQGGRAALVNAVLRNYLRSRQKAEQKPPRDPIKRISIMTSHPEWLVRRWVSRMGIEEAEKLAVSNNETPPLTLRIDTDRGEALELLAAGGIDAVAARYSPSGVIVKGRISARDDNGDSQDAESAERRRVTPYNIPLPGSSFVIQDEAAQLVSWLLDPQPGEKVLDACAAPGGKATHIARLMKDRGEVIAVDADKGRTVKIMENISRLGLRSVSVLAGDIRDCEPGLDFDRVLIDAPCSSIGVIRRNPDVKYRHAETDLARFGALQLQLLNRAAGYMKIGGVMVYSVCSTEPEEGEDVVRAFLQSSPNFSIIEGVYDFLSGFAYNDSNGHIFYRTWPHKGARGSDEQYGMDGFFAARIKKAGGPEDQ